MVAQGMFCLHRLVVAKESGDVYKRVGYFNCNWHYRQVSDLHWYLDFVGAANGGGMGNFYGLITLV